MQATRRQSLQLAPTTDVKALMSRNAGKYDMALDQIWNGEHEQQAQPFRKEEIAFHATKKQSSLPTMTKITIIIPVEHYSETENYYRDTLSFSVHEGLFFLPVDSRDVALKLIIVDGDAKRELPPQRHFPIFRYSLEKNFLAYCKKIYENGALIQTAFSHPGGYYARVSDPAGNQFEIECENFEEDDPSVDCSTMPFFFNY